MRAFLVTRAPSAPPDVRLEEAFPDAELMPGDVTIDVAYSSVNFKDGLALAGRPGVIRGQRVIPGIDLVGTVARSDHPAWNVGDGVILNGWGIGESHHGGLAERARVSGDWLMPLPAGLEPRHAAAVGTAGLTAMSAILAIERHAPVDGEVLVTGAAGGVGSLAIALLAAAGHSAVASTGRWSEGEYLQTLGATRIIERAGLSRPSKPLEHETWAAAIDCVGSSTLATILAQTRYGGIVTSCGLAQGSDLPGTVMPFILRAVSLVGINSVYAPMSVRRDAWARITADLDRDLLDSLTTIIPLASAVDVAHTILNGGVRGRTVVDVRA